jgi:hypothetical protein
MATEKKMKREANTDDIPVSIMLTVPRIIMRVVREKDKSGPSITEIRLGKVCLYFAGSVVTAFTYIYPDKPNDDRSELIYELFARDSQHGRFVAAYLKKQETVFNDGNGQPFEFLASGRRYHAALHRAISLESNRFLQEEVDKLLNKASE